MIGAQWPTLTVTLPLPTQFGSHFIRPPFLSPNSLLYLSILKPKTSLGCCCVTNDTRNKPAQGFSVLESHIPWESGSIWSTMAAYMFNLHIPLGFGGLSIVSYLLRRPTLDPQIQALSLLVLQILELVGTLFLLRSTIKPQYTLMSFFEDNKVPKERNWLLASALGFGFLMLLVFATSLLADRLIGSKVTNNPIVKEMLESSNLSKAACVLVYCVITPLLEELVYRGFLLTSLASSMNWQRAVVVSSAIFSAAHFSGENSLQLFFIGCVLGCSYCWSGNLSSSIVIHSFYNALTLIITLLS